MMAKNSTRTSDARSEAAIKSSNELATGAKELQATTKEVVRQHRPGQPTKFTHERWEAILECVATFGDLIEACDKPDMPNVGTIYKWMRANPQLKEDMRSAWEMFTYVGNSVNNNILSGGKLSTGDFRRDEALAAQNRWFMSKTNRRDFGDKQQIEHVHYEPVIIDVTATQGPGGDGV